MAKSGFLIWITGLAGSGKTSLGKVAQNRLAASINPVVLLDGDTLREVTGGIFGFELEDRRKCAEFYSRLCALLTSQGINVICCTISMFDSVRAMNRETVGKYFEVYLKASDELLAARDQKKLYSELETEALVVGRGMPVEEPKNPDLVFDLGEGGLDLGEIVKSLVKAIDAKGWTGNAT